MNKYGIENFKVEELEEIDNSELNNHERYWIDYFKDLNQAKYNIAEGGDGGDLFSNHTEDEKLKIKAKLHDAFVGENNPMFGKHHSEEAKEKIRQSYTPEWIQLYSENNMGSKNPMFNKEPWNKGKEMSDEFKKLAQLNNSGENNNNYGHKYGEAFNHTPVILYFSDGTLKEFTSKLECGEYLGYKYGGNVPINKLIKSKDPKRNNCIVKYK